MSENKIITELTPEQEALIPVYRDKWLKIALSTERVDEDKATEAIKAGYNMFNIKVPKIVFLDSPYLAFKKILSSNSDYLYSSILTNINTPLTTALCLLDREYGGIRKRTEIKREMNQLTFEPEYIIYEHLEKSLKPNKNVTEKYFYSEFHYNSISICSELDFYISILKLPYNQNTWNIRQNLAIYCGWIFESEDTCIVCNRPTSLSFDEQNNLHADGKPAIEYADGFKVYSHHGIWIPEKYGSIPSSEWCSHWLLNEKNAELRRILIQSFGYDRICKELGAIELDSWNEYTLLKIENYTELKSRRSKNLPEPMHLLKMTCPSTGFIHFLRVPPDITSARESIRWVNWGLDPKNLKYKLKSN